MRIRETLADGVANGGSLRAAAGSPRRIDRVVAAVGIATGLWVSAAGAPQSASDAPPGQGGGRTLLDAQRAFYNARYDEAAAQALELRSADPDDLAAYELRTSALHFQIKAALGGERDRSKALKQCEECREWMDAFLSDTAAGRTLARAKLAADPEDDVALFFLGKLDLNYVWLQLGTLGRRTGWDEYWEARRSLDAVLKRQPEHVRARVARGWIDYIVDTRMPRGTRWILGGGNKKRALATIREAAATEADFFIKAEAMFALWDLHVREQNLAEAVTLAQGLARDFPENRELVKFLDAQQNRALQP